MYILCFPSLCVDQARELTNSLHMTHLKHEKYLIYCCDNFYNHERKYSATGYPRDLEDDMRVY